MNEAPPLNFRLTETAIEKLKELIEDENNPNLMLRVAHPSGGDWQFTFDDVVGADDRVLEFDGLRIVLTEDMVNGLRDATVDFSDDKEFSIRNAIPLESERGCRHLDELPSLPAADQLKAMRKGLRRQKMPVSTTIDHGQHEMIGSFELTESPTGIIAEWCMPGGQTKCFSLQELTQDSSREIDRRELGWLIANMAQLDMLHQLEEAKTIPHPDYCMREMSRIMGYFGKIEKRWRHWAIIPPGHVLA